MGRGHIYRLDRRASGEQLVRIGVRAQPGGPDLLRSPPKGVSPF